MAIMILPVLISRSSRFLLMGLSRFWSETGQWFSLSEINRIPSIGE
jgi:hypothetical protein